jgi:hypothetical protein
VSRGFAGDKADSGYVSLFGLKHVAEHEDILVLEPGKHEVLDVMVWEMLFFSTRMDTLQQLVLNTS